MKSQLWKCCCLIILASFAGCSESQQGPVETCFSPDGLPSFTNGQGDVLNNDLLFTYSSPHPNCISQVIGFELCYQRRQMYMDEQGYPFFVVGVFEPLSGDQFQVIATQLAQPKNDDNCFPDSTIINTERCCMNRPISDSRFTLTSTSAYCILTPPPNDAVLLLGFYDVSVDIHIMAGMGHPEPGTTISAGSLATNFSLPIFHFIVEQPIVTTSSLLPSTFSQPFSTSPKLLPDSLLLSPTMSVIFSSHSAFAVSMPIGTASVHPTPVLNPNSRTSSQLMTSSVVPTSTSGNTAVLIGVTTLLTVVILAALCTGFVAGILITRCTRTARYHTNGGSHQTQEQTRDTADLSYNRTYAAFNPVAIELRKNMAYTVAPPVNQIPATGGENERRISATYEEIR